MKKERLQVVKDEIERLSLRIEELENKIKDRTFIDPSKESSAVRRASMDLSRALTNLRKSDSC